MPWFESSTALVHVDSISSSRPTVRFLFRVFCDEQVVLSDSVSVLVLQVSCFVFGSTEMPTFNPTVVLK